MIAWTTGALIAEPGQYVSSMSLHQKLSKAVRLRSVVG